MLLLEKLIFSLMFVRALKGAYIRILELGKKRAGFNRGLCVGHTPGGTRGHTDNADRWLCVSLSQFFMHLEVREF